MSARILNFPRPAAPFVHMATIRGQHLQALVDYKHRCTRATRFAYERARAEAIRLNVWGCAS